MVVADECKLQQEPNACYRWNPKRKTPVIKVNRKKQSVSIYGGLSKLTNKVITHFCQWQESKETIKFLGRIKQHWLSLRQELDHAAPLLLVWDGASWHKSQEVKLWLKSNPGVVELMNFPPYSPELNPQEKVWKALRQHLLESLIRDQFDITIKRAKSFLKNRKFHYRII